MSRHPESRVAIALSTLALAASSIASLTLLGLAPEIQHSLGLSALGIGAISSFVYLSGMASAWLSGVAVARWGAVGPICGSLTLLAAGLMICAISADAVPFFAGVLVLGMGYGGVNPPTNVLVDNSGMARSGLTVSIKQAGMPLGGVVAGVIASAASRAGHWRDGVLAAIVFCIALAVIQGVALRRLQRPIITRDILPFTGTHSVMLDVIGFLLGGVQTATLAYVAIYAADDRGFPLARAAIAFTIVMIGSVIGRLLWGFIADQAGNLAWVLGIACVSAAASVLAMVILPAMMLWVVLPIIGATCGGWNGVYLALVMKTVGPGAVARRTGRAQVVINAGAVCMPLAFGMLVTRMNSWPGAWSAVAASAAAGAALAWYVERRIRLNTFAQSRTCATSPKIISDAELRAGGDR
jgi:MFS family permease